MKKILVPVADGFEEIETMTIIDVLRRAGLDVTVAGASAGELKGSRGVRLVPDTELEKVVREEYDLVVLPGGQPGVDNLRKNPLVLELLQTMNQKHKMIGAICAAPLALRDAGLTAGKRYTGYPAMEDEFTDGHYDRHDRVIVDDRLVTSQGPATAMEFSLKLVELMCSRAKAEEVAGALLTHL